MVIYFKMQGLKADGLKWALLTVLVVFVSACNDSKNTTASGEASLDAVVLATVNGKSITQDDIDFTIERTFSNADQLFVDASIKEKVLQSLIAASAMRQVMKATLSAGDLEDIRRKTNAYEEELYLKAYLREFAVPEPVTTVMVDDYYRKIPEQFGGIKVKTVELLSSAGEPSLEQRDGFLAAVSGLKDETDWKGFADKNTSLNLVYKKIKLQPGLLDKNLEKAVKKIAPGGMSSVVFVNKVATVARVLEEKQLMPKPLHEVSADIRKKLAPIQLKKAVKNASEQAVENAEVVMKSLD